MANWAANKIEAPAHLLRALLNDEGQVDFNLIVPQPEDIETGNCSGATDEAGRHKDGSMCWYEWNNEHWGTKGNADSDSESLRPDSGELRFYTAWASPRPVVVALARRFPQERIVVTASDPAMAWAERITVADGKGQIESYGWQDAGFRLIVEDLFGDDYFVDEEEAL